MARLNAKDAVLSPEKHWKMAIPGAIVPARQERAAMPPKDESQKVYTFYRYASRGAAALAAICLSAAYMTAPDEGFEQTPEFTDKKHELRAQFQAACEQESPALNQSVRECIEERSHNAAVNSQIGLAPRVLFMLSVTFGFQAVGLRIGQSMSGRRLKETGSKDSPSP
ncbi:MAG: hypothetical protein HYU57_04805 [Micavibrio aeruginosavorus]|nr:hypothetical protein [Micavibrio aeruginosavorus]